MPALRQLPRSSAQHLRWLYLLVAIPILTDVIEKGTWPTTAREYVTEMAMALVVILFVAAHIRQSEKLALQTDSYIRTKEQLQHADRLVTVGRLAAGVAHELGSPLQVVAGRAKMIATGETGNDDAKESGQIIVDQARRMTQIIRGLLDFSRRRPPQQAPIDLQDITREVHRLLGPIAKKKAVVLELELGEVRVVRVDAIQVQQALTNLVMNAIQAVREGGRVTIALNVSRATPPPDHSILQRLPPANPDTSCASLSVADDGPGIPEEHLPHVFEPFFTTKDVGEGTGLGLAVVHGLVRENGGWLTVESEVGKGARFSMFFPLNSERGPSS